jgi:hypothetical protein
MLQLFCCHHQQQQTRFLRTAPATGGNGAGSLVPNQFQARRCVATALHPKWDKATTRNDIAACVLDRPSTYAPVEFASGAFASFVLAGWGRVCLAEQHTGGLWRCNKPKLKHTPNNKNNNNGAMQTATRRSAPARRRRSPALAPSLRAAAAPRSCCWQT